MNVSHTLPNFKRNEKALFCLASTFGYMLMGGKGEARGVRGGVGGASAGITTNLPL